MYQNSTVGVVVPAYNEEGFVGDVLRKIPAYVDRIYAINDCSTDGTWEEIVEVSNDEVHRSQTARPNDASLSVRTGPSATFSTDVPIRRPFDSSRAG